MSGAGTSTSQQNVSSTGTQRQQTTPWGGTGDIISGLLGGLTNVNPNVTPNENWALSGLENAGFGGNPFAGQIGNVANGLLSGGGPDRSPVLNDAYNRLVGQLMPTASGDFTDPSKNPFFTQTTQTIGDDIQKRLDALYAGSGRAPSGAGGDYTQQLARGISEGTAPVFSSVYQGERANQLGAANSLFGAGNTTATGLLGMDQTRLGNQIQGIGAAGSALDASQWGPQQVLQAEAARRGIPTQSLASLLDLIMRPAQAFGTTTGNTTGTGTQTGSSTMSPIQQFAGITQGIQNLYPRVR